MTTATVIRVWSRQISRDTAILGLDCGHFTIVPQDDEDAYSFVGAETECAQHEFDLTEGVQP